MNNNAHPSTSPVRAQKEKERDVHSSGGFLFKASNSLRRSPSKKHKSQPSDQMPTLDGVLFDHQNSNSPPTRTPATPHRPGFNRAPSAPVTLQPFRSTTNANKDDKPPQSAGDATMTTLPFGYNTAYKKEHTSNLSKSMSAPPMKDEAGNSGTAPSVLLPAPLPISAAGSQNPNVIYQHIHDMASKRISTLDYMRKASVHS